MHTCGILVSKKTRYTAITKALSIRQPWASLIASGHKTIENRTWQVGYRGPLLIHAGQSGDRRFYKGKTLDMGAWLAHLARYGLDATGTQLADPAYYQRGGVLARARLVDIVEESDDTWFRGPYGWMLQDIAPTAFVPYPGALWLFDVPDALIATETRG